MRLTLYRQEGCSYCERVADKLDELGLTYDSEWVGRRHSEREAVNELTGQRQVPVLVDPDHHVTMAESANIVTYLDGTYGET